MNFEYKVAAVDVSQVKACTVHIHTGAKPWTKPFAFYIVVERHEDMGK